MLLVAGINVKNPTPRFWDPESPYYMPGIRAVMVSFSEFGKFPTRLASIKKIGLRKYLGVPDTCQVFLDNGAFHTLKREMEFDSKSYRAFVETAQPNWFPIPVEHIPHPSMRKVDQEKYFRTTMIYNHRYAKLGYVPVVHAGAFLPQFLDGIERIASKTSITKLGLGAMVPFLLRSKGAMGRSQVVDDILKVRRRLPSVRIHGFGIGGTATLHIAAVLGLDSIDSTGWRNRAARGIIQLRGTGDRLVADFGKWRGRKLSLKERRSLNDCACPSCNKGGLKVLEKGGLDGFAARATHNLWVLENELKDIEHRLAMGTYLAWYMDHVNNPPFLRLLTRAIENSTLTSITKIAG